MDGACQPHLHVAYRVLQYIKHTPTYSLFYPPTTLYALRLLMNLIGLHVQINVNLLGLVWIVS